MDAQEALELCSEILEVLDDLPEAAADFADGVREKVESMQAWIEKHDLATDAMVDALENMQTGVGKWIR